MSPIRCTREAAMGISALVLSLTLSANGLGAPITSIVIDLPTRDLVYSPLDLRLYATVPNSSPTSPNMLVPIDPNSGNIGTGIPIGFDPHEVVISDNGTTMHVVVGGRRAIQPFDVSNQSLGTVFALPGGPEVKQIYAIPGRPDAVLIATHAPGFSPPATGTQVWENGVRLPDRVGDGLGTGGPDIVTIDPTDGGRGYGYQNTISGYDHWAMGIDANGVHVTGVPALQNVMTGSNIGQIALLGDRLFNSRGEVYSIPGGFQIGAFHGGENFILDPGLGRLFSMTSVGSTHTLRTYALDTLELIDTEMISGIPGTSASLTRFGNAGVAFKTSNNQVVLLPGAIVPEPTTGILAMAALVVGGYFAHCRRSR